MPQPPSEPPAAGPRAATMNPPCARCGKVVYPTEKVTCLDKYWHKGCFHCEVCRMALNMNNYKGYDKKPYCNAHYPKQSFTTVADTPENLRLKQQSELQSQVKYKRDFEESKGRGFSIVTDTPELQRLKRTQEQISNVGASPPCCRDPLPQAGAGVGAVRLAGRVSPSHPRRPHRGSQQPARGVGRRVKSTCRCVAFAVESSGGSVSGGPVLNGSQPWTFSRKETIKLRSQSLVCCG
ncbi:LIM zinc-binding domain-containing Nebulette-like [Dasypus novemcinctus]|uniref:LIM zinc-binding domain-containing Nebulette-like n=1 Tax=Dasypus novemcinctus TaxID=9361 RepID=UPI0039C9564C